MPRVQELSLYVLMLFVLSKTSGKLLLTDVCNMILYDILYYKKVLKLCCGALVNVFQFFDENVCSVQHP